MINKVLIAVGIGLVVVLLAIKLIRGKTAARRELFRRFIKEMQKKIESTHLRDFKLENSLAFHVNVKHVPELEREIVEVEPCLGSRRRKKMETAFAKYKNLGQQAGDEKKNATVKEQMLSLLDEISRCAR